MSCTCNPLVRLTRKEAHALACRVLAEHPVKGYASWECTKIAAGIEVILGSCAETTSIDLTRADYSELLKSTI